jgi:nucleotide-binding universal stress UspA family protein
VHRILVATDGSGGADRAVDYAAHVAKNDGADLFIVSVVGSEVILDNVFGRITNAQQTWFKEMLASESAEILTKARDRARTIGVSKIQIESRTGNLAQTIIEVAREKKADAIVVGRRGAGRIAGLLLGSLSQKLVSLAPQPVTVVP